MSKSGQELLASIKSMRSFLADVSHLLQASDRLMGESGWEPKDTNCLDGLSYTVSTGAKWMPRESCRTYRNISEFPGLAIMIAVILDDFERDYQLVEPAVVATLFSVPDDYRIWNWQAHYLGWDGKPADGKSHTYSKEDEPDWKSSWGWSKLTYFGHPLVEVTNESRLAELIVQPVLKLVENNRGK